MGSVQVSVAGRSDQTRASLTAPQGEPSLNQNAALSPDQYVYEAQPERCTQLKLNGERCNGKAITGKQGLCMVHCERVVVDDES